MKKILTGVGIGVMATLGYVAFRFKKGVKVGDLIRVSKKEETENM